MYAFNELLMKTGPYLFGYKFPNCKISSEKELVHTNIETDTDTCYTDRGITFRFRGRIGKLPGNHAMHLNPSECLLLAHSCHVRLICFKSALPHIIRAVLGPRYVAK